MNIIIENIYKFYKELTITASRINQKEAYIRVENENINELEEIKKQVILLSNKRKRKKITEDNIKIIVTAPQYAPEIKRYCFYVKINSEIKKRFIFTFYRTDENMKVVGGIYVFKERYNQNTRSPLHSADPIRAYRNGGLNDGIQRGRCGSFGRFSRRYDKRCICS